MAMHNLSVAENPFTGRILAEPAIFSGASFRIVEDKDPVAAGHLLLFATDSRASLADTDVLELCAFLTEFQSHIRKSNKCVLVERGRASFCSSFDGVIHAHAHILECRDGIGWIGGTRFHNLAEALQQVGSSGEYLLMGYLGGEFEILYPFEAREKRVARRILGGGRLAVA
jgi:hypothetical protein